MIIRCLANHYLTTLVEVFTNQTFYCPECKEEYSTATVKVEVSDNEL